MRFRHLLYFFALTVHAQTLQLSGLVSDVQSIPIGDTTVTLTTATEAGRRTAMTDGSGRYSFTGLASGPYSIVFERAGFEAVSRSGQLSADTEINITLPIAGEVTSIEVTDVAGKATASRLDIPNSDLPVQVSVIPQALLQQQAVNSMVDALKNASGVQAFRWYGVYEYYTIRGFNQADVMLVDGMRLEGNRYNTQTNNIESVEVLKGPTSLLYGGGALGGVINIVRKKPQGTRAYDFMYRGGRFNSHTVGGGATGPIGNLDRLLYRVDASFDHSDGWRGAGQDRLNVSPSITWLISPRARVTVHQAFNRDRLNGDGGVDIRMTTLPNYDPTWRFSLPQDNALAEDSQTHVLFNMNLTKNWEFRDGFLLRRSSDRYFVTEGIYYSPADNTVSREPLDFHHTVRPTQNQADLIGRLNFLGMHHTLLAGYEYQDFFRLTDVTAGDDPTCGCGYWVNTITPINLTTYDPKTYVEETPRLDLDTVYRKTYQANQIHAIYWQDQIDVLPNLKINVGGRFDDYDRRLHRTFAPDFTTRTGIQTRQQTAYTYRAGVVYSPGKGHQVYFNTSTSFTPVTTVPVNQQDLNPQRGRMFEVGHRWKSVSSKQDWSVAFYKIDRDNHRIAVSPILIAQVGYLRSKGVDLDFSTQLLQGIRLITAYGFAQAHIDDPGNALDNRRPRFVPRHTANAWLRKEWESGFSASLGVRYVGNQFLNDNNATRLGGYTTLSGAMGYRARRWEWTLNADNLLNRERYFTPGQFANLVFPGSPINVNSTIRLRFNQAEETTMRRLTIAIKKTAIVCHRWMGVAFCVLFMWWFVSGIVMMYWTYPSVTEADRLARAPKLDPARVKLSPAEALKAAGFEDPPGAVTLGSFDGRPIYQFRVGRGSALVYADTGEQQDVFPPDLNLRTAARWTGQAGESAKVETVSDPDQWTIGVRRQLPLQKYTFPDGQQVYISEDTGQVVQYTTTFMRVISHLGVIPHWLYYTPLRVNGQLWTRVVVWSSGIATIAALLGLIVGIWMLSPSQKYRHQGQATAIPYTGQKRLHTILGLFFGILTMTWAFSGMLSMDPFPNITSGGPIGGGAGKGKGKGNASPAQRVQQAFGGGRFNAAAYDARHPAEVLAQLGPDSDVRELDYSTYLGEPVFHATSGDGVTRVLPVSEATAGRMNQNQILSVVQQAGGDAIAEAKILNQYDAYYLDRTHTRPLPVVYVQMKDAGNTRLYIDPETARVVGRYADSRGAWVNRWLYHGLHSLDLPWLYNNRPAWDIVVLALMLACVWLCWTSIVLSWRVVKRKFAPARRAPSEDLAV